VFLRGLTSLRKSWYNIIRGGNMLNYSIRKEYYKWSGENLVRVATVDISGDKPEQCANAVKEVEKSIRGIKEQDR
jgi:hypothetical protein